MSRTSDWIVWKPRSTGNFTLTLEVPKHGDESLTDNNRMTAPISIREEKLRVLVVESYPRWEYRYLRNALSRDPGVELSCLLFHPGLSKVGGGNKDYIKQFPAGLDELSRYDVVFLGDVGTGRWPVDRRAVPADQGAGASTRPAGWSSCPAWRGGSSRCWRPSWAISIPWCSTAAQPGGWGSRTPNHFELTESGRPQPADQAGRYAGRQRRGLGGLARLPVVRAGAPGQGRQRGARRAQGRGQRVRPPAPAGHPDIRRRQGALHGHRRRLAVAQGGRGQVPLPLLGPGGALDGLPAEHGQGRDDAAVLCARPAQDEPDCLARTPTSWIARASRCKGGDVSARITAPSGKSRARSVHVRGRRVGRLHRAIHAQRARQARRDPVLQADRGDSGDVASSCRGRRPSAWAGPPGRRCWRRSRG